MSEQFHFPLPVGYRAPLQVAAGKQAGAKNNEDQDESSGVRQMLGMKGAALETDIWKIRLQLTKPVTWVPLIWGTYKASWT